jgi:3'-phosphoadenosine 5'-phosphosulfate sulfotransferase (PAPS reductase)/FAD synthetase
MNHDQFKTNGPTCISFSGGRTSAYMLWRVLQAHGGKLPDECVVTFANTGKEEEATLRFTRDCGNVWNVPIVWLEYDWDAERRFRIVDFDSASRGGEPFERCIKHYNMKLPNPVNRWCSGDMKHDTIIRYLRTLDAFETEDGWDTFIGIRADEQRRAVKLKDTRAKDQRREMRRLPLVEAGVTVKDIEAFWKSQPFDLELPNNGGKTMHGNCDLCFLKPAAQIVSLIAEKPSRAIWWARMESEVQATGKVIGGGGVFRQDRPSYADMLHGVASQVDFVGHADEEAIACYCGE